MIFPNDSFSLIETNTGVLFTKKLGLNSVLVYKRPCVLR